jgi:glutamate--cysteine ligase
VAQLALGAPWANGTVRDLAREVVRIARDGLIARDETDDAGNPESIYLQPLEVMLDGGLTQAEHWLNCYTRDWGGDVSRIFEESAV